MKIDACLTSIKQDYRTPKHLFIELNKIYKFECDAAASKEHHLCEKYYSENFSALDQPWDFKSIYCNPPYNKLKQFTLKAQEEAFFDPSKIIVMLVPFRPDTQAFQLINRMLIFAIRGRLKFELATQSAPFPSCLLVFNNNKRYQFKTINGVWLDWNKNDETMPRY
jgi:phage N-6-adenine-methyltransferase